ncbi:hypothetical protein MMC07_008391 [Pseudocyphellaria aurata]|nr:hypothetical protein [Pseudocyphellaria aurata]
MHSITTLTSSLLLAAGVLAQYGSSSDSGYGAGSGSSGSDFTANVSPTSPPASMASLASTSPAVTVHIHIVKVSNKRGELTFTPSTLKAAAGSFVQFQFYPKKHSIVQSTFDNPCVPINQVKPEEPGFFSGFMPVQAGDTTLPTYTIVVNDTKPIWYYCSQGDHCQDGMVGVINPPPRNHSLTQESFAALAKNVPVGGSEIAPSESPAGGSSSSSGSSTSPGSGSSVTTGIPAPSGTSIGSGLRKTESTILRPSAWEPAASPSTSPGSGNTLAIRRDFLTGVGLSALLGLSMAFA